MREDWFRVMGPWQIAEEKISSGVVGEIAEICIQEVIESDAGDDKLDEWLGQWRARLDPLVGHVTDESVNSSGLSVSVLLQYDSGTIVRLFADTQACGSGPALDFDVVGTDQSLVYRTSSGALASFFTQADDGTTCGRIIRSEFVAPDLLTQGQPGPKVHLGIISLDHPHSTGNHLPALEHMRHLYDVVAIAHGDLAACRPYMDTFGARRYETRDQLLADTEIDVVLVTSENHYHAADAIAAMRAGKDVLCDKPISTNPADARAIADARGETGVRFVTTFPVRVHPAVRELKELIDRGALGELVAMSGTNHGCMYEPGAPDWVKDPARNGGGSIIDHTVHVADTFRFLSGQEFEDVRTFACSRLMNISAEDISASQGKMTGGTLFQIDSSWSRKGADPAWGDLTLRIVGTRGAASLDLYNNHQVQIYTDSGIELHYPDSVTHSHGMIFADYHAERNSDKSGANDDEIDGLRTMELVFAAYESVRTGSTTPVLRYRPAGKSAPSPA